MDVPEKKQVTVLNEFVEEYTRLMATVQQLETRIQVLEKSSAISSKNSEPLLTDTVVEPESGVTKSTNDLREELISILTNRLGDAKPSFLKLSSFIGEKGKEAIALINSLASELELDVQDATILISANEYDSFHDKIMGLSEIMGEDNLFLSQCLQTTIATLSNKYSEHMVELKTLATFLDFELIWPQYDETVFMKEHEVTVDNEQFEPSIQQKAERVIFVSQLGLKDSNGDVIMKAKVTAR